MKILMLLTPIKARTSRGKQKKGKKDVTSLFSMCMNASSDLQVEGPSKYFKV